MQLKPYFKTIRTVLMMAAVSTFVLTSCGDDDPVNPEPVPTPDPDPTPTVTYNGFGCSFVLDSIAGDSETFMPMLRDTMELYCPGFTEESAFTYTASVVYESTDPTDMQSLTDDFWKFHSVIANMQGNLQTPVVTANMQFGTLEKPEVTSDWSFSFSFLSSAVIRSTLSFAIPALRHCIWVTEDAKELGVNSLTFSTWTDADGGKATLKGTVVVNGTDSYIGYRQGSHILLLDPETLAKRYVFSIDNSGESISLLIVDGNTIAKDDQPVFSFSENTGAVGTDDEDE